jgi:hypothetical protein
MGHKGGGGFEWRTGNGKGQCGGLSTAPRTVELFAAPVEMTILGREKGEGRREKGEGGREKGLVGSLTTKSLVDKTVRRESYLRKD